MDWEKASPELGELLIEAARPFALVETRKMFGGVSLFINGNMIGGVHGKKIVLRLNEQDRVAAERDADMIPFEPMPGRLMKEYVVVPDSVYQDPDGFEEWLRRSVEFVGSLPVKEAKPRKRKDPGGR